MRVVFASMVSVLPKSQMPAGYQLRPAPCPISPVGTDDVQPLGVFQTNISYGNATASETVFVLDDTNGPVPSLLVEQVSIALGLLPAPVSAKKADLPTDEVPPLPAMHGSVSIQLDPAQPPKQQSSRRVAPALLSSLKEQLAAWVDQGVLEPVDEVKATDFVSPLVAVPMPDKSTRWCVDLRQINQAVRRPGVQLPTTDDLLSQLAGAKFFSKLDLKSGYSQLGIDRECRHAFVIAIPLGYFRFCRLLFGVSSGPEIFQQKMEQILSSCKGVLIYLDDLLIIAAGQEEHDRRLAVVRAALESYGVTLNDKKCVLDVPELVFLGHHVSAEGVSPDQEKVKALQHVPDPTDVSQLRSFLGLVTYLVNSIPNMADVTAPLTGLLSGPWQWTTECSQAADSIRQHFLTDQILALFDPTLPTRIEVDASGQGLGAVLMQSQQPNADVDSSGWRPVYYASRKLTGPEARYAAIEREALAVTWGLHRFRNFITGMPVVVLSDHKPLLQVFSPSYNLSAASLRIQWLVLKCNISHSRCNFARVVLIMSLMPCLAFPSRKPTSVFSSATQFRFPMACQPLTAVR